MTVDFGGTNTWTNAVEVLKLHGPMTAMEIVGYLEPDLNLKSDRASHIKSNITYKFKREISRGAPIKIHNKYLYRGQRKDMYIYEWVGER